MFGVDQCREGNIDGLFAVLCEHDHHAATIIGVRGSGDQPFALEFSEAMGHRTGTHQGFLQQVLRTQRKGGTRATQGCQNIKFPRLQPAGAKRCFSERFDALANTADS